MLALDACSHASLAPERVAEAPAGPPGSVIYMGNSFFYFNNGINAHMSGLIAAGMPGFKHRATMVTISGSGAAWHEMTQGLADAYTAAGRENHAEVIPAGLAFARSVAARPDIELYFTDKRHPSVAGSYLSACTTYATLFRKSPVGLSYTAGLDPAVARHLQTMAWETVQAYRQPI